MTLMNITGKIVWGRFFPSRPGIYQLGKVVNLAYDEYNNCYRWQGKSGDYGIRAEDVRVSLGKSKQEIDILCMLYPVLNGLIE